MENLKDLFYEYYCQSDEYQALGQIPEVKDVNEQFYKYLDTLPRSVFIGIEELFSKIEAAAEAQGWVYGYKYAMSLLADMGLVKAGEVA